MRVRTMLVATAAAASATALIGGGVAFAGAPSDDRAEFIAGNVQEGDCPEGTEELSKTDDFQWTLSDFDGEPNAAVTISSVSEGVVITDIYVKGGDDTNRYQPGLRELPTDPPYEDLISPLNNGGNVPAISHWFACGTQGPPPSTTTPGSTTTVPGSTTSIGETTTTDLGSTTTSLAGSTTTTLPNTGATSASLIGVALLAVLGGAVAMMLARRRAA